MASPPIPNNQPDTTSHQRAATRRDRAGWLVLLALGPLLFALLQLNPTLDTLRLHDPLVHVLAAGTTALLGMGLALLVLQLATRANDGRIFLVGLGFLAAASLFLVHALATPNVLMSGRGTASAISAPASLIFAGLLFGASGLELSERANRRLMRRSGWLIASFMVGWAVYSWLLLAYVPGISTRAVHAAEPAPTAVHTYDEYGEYHTPAEQPAPTTPPPLTHPLLGLLMASELHQPLVVIGVLGYSFALVQHYRLYRRTPSRTGWALLCGIGLLGEALVIQPFAPVYAPSFWLYHSLELAGFVVISYALLVVYRSGQTDVGLLDGLLLPGTRARMQAAYASAMEALVDTLSRGEQPTAELVTLLRARFNLTDSQLQVLAQSAAALAHERRQRAELERLNVALREHERYREQMTQMLIHDLKNPLTAVVGFLDLLKLSTLDSDQRELVLSALQSGRNLAALIGDLLDVGRMQAGHVELERSWFAPHDLLSATANELRAWAMLEGRTIIIETAATLPSINADKRLIQRVLANLTTNAIKHTQPGTTITLRAMHTASSPGWLVIEVHDTGPGIAPHDQARIFERYGRAQPTSGEQRAGTGLGLTFCRLAVEAHGGTIGIQSSLGVGTTFRVSLPVA